LCKSRCIACHFQIQLFHDYSISLYFGMTSFLSLLVRFLKNLFTSGTWDQHGDNIELRYKYLLVNTISIYGMILFTGFGIFDTINGIQPIGYIITSIGLIVALNFVYLRITKKLKISSYVNVSIISAMYIFLLATGGAGNTGVLWLYPFPVAILLVLGLRGGTVVTLTLLVATFIILFVPNFPLLTATYTRAFKLRLFPTMLCVMTLTFLLEYIRSLTQEKLRERNLELLGMVTEIKRAEAALLDEKEHLSVTLRSIGDGVITTDTRRRIILINEAAESLTGWKENEALGEPFDKVFLVTAIKRPGEDVQEPQPMIRLQDFGAIPHTGVLVDRNNRRRIISTSGAPIRDKQGSIIGTVVVFRDVTERQKMEDELLKSRKLESIGLLAGGIAHDFNNILMGIQGNIDLAAMKVTQQDDPREFLKTAKQATKRASGLTQQLLTFSKGGTPVTEITDLEDLIRKTTSLVMSGSNVKCEFNIDDDLWPAKIDPGQIGQVISNLLINAQHAMPQGGTVVIGASNKDVNAGQLPSLESGEYVRLLVTDTGAGIPEENLSVIFDPYFSTKKNGNGLGLATSYAIVTKHHGRISVQSQEATGTSFTIYLPASKSAMPEKVAEDGSMPSGNGRILIMDDDEHIRQVLEVSLSKFGYQTESSQDGREAIDKYRLAYESGNPFCAVIMDLTVPGGMGGEDAVRGVLAIDPEATVIVSSGYSNDPILSNFANYGFQGCIRKPFSISALLNTLQSSLRENPTQPRQ